MEVIDRKFRILAVNPDNGHIYTQNNALGCTTWSALKAA